MMGQQVAQGALFYAFRLDDQVPSDHLLRHIDGLLDFGFVREAVAATYSSTGRPSVDPEMMLRMLLVGYLFGIRLERRLCEEVHLSVAYCWFCRFDLRDRVPTTPPFPRTGMAASASVTCIARCSSKWSASAPQRGWWPAAR